MTLNPNAPVFVPRSEQNDFYYHVTKEKNLNGIIKSGLQPKFGGTDGGMSDLRFKSQASASNLSSDFVEGSKNKVHFSDSWDAVERYCQHCLTLTAKIANSGQGLVTEDTMYDRIPPGELPVILRCYKKNGKTFLEKDQHDEQGLTTTQATTADTIWIAVEFKNTSTPTDGPFYWLPIAYWDPKRYRPAYPDSPNLPTRYSR